MSQDQRAERNPFWKGGRHRTSGGYVSIRIPEHPRASNGYVFEHIVVSERALGRYLPLGVEIHHVDEDKENNVGGNLVVCPDRSYHQLLHQRANALRVCGDPSALKCNICQSYERQSDLHIRVRPDGGKVARHRSCHAAAGRRRRARARVDAPRAEIVIAPL